MSGEGRAAEFNKLCRKLQLLVADTGVPADITSFCAFIHIGLSGMRLTLGVSKMDAAGFLADLLDGAYDPKAEEAPPAPVRKVQ